MYQPIIDLIKSFAEKFYSLNSNPTLSLIIDLEKEEIKISGLYLGWNLKIEPGDGVNNYKKDIFKLKPTNFKTIMKELVNEKSRTIKCFKINNLTFIPAGTGYSFLFGVNVPGVLDTMQIIASKYTLDIEKID